MSTASPALFRPHTVTFDCWATLLYEVGPSQAPGDRVRILADFVGVGDDEARAALRTAWERHQVLWHRGIAFTGVHMTRHALEILGSPLAEVRERELLEALETQVLRHEVRALEGARETLQFLAQAGVRRALICDTGFTPGRVVRQLLQRVGLLEFLEVTVFSDEVGVPKPDPKAFLAALGPLGVGPAGAVHVGDIRRSDVAGAKKAQMGSVRLRMHHDDTDELSRQRAGVIDCGAAGCSPACERPEADAVADSHRQLPELFGLR